MAVRTISTKLAVEGESEYRSTVSRINVELKALQSALRLTESQFKANANSMEALTAKGTSLRNLYDAQETKVKKLRDALENARQAEEQWAQTKADLDRRIEENKKALEELGERTEANAEAYDRLTNETKELSKEKDAVIAKLDAAGRGVDNWQAKLNSAQVKLNDLNAEIEINDKYLEEARKSADGCAKSIDEFGNRVDKSQTALEDMATALASAGVIQAFDKMTEAIEGCVGASVEFESAMAGVKKTTDMTPEELGAMANAIQDLSTRIPATTTEIAGVAEAAGQLGIEKDKLLEFSEVMVNLGVATNLSSEEAASSLAKFANVVNMSADNYERLGSTIVDLGNNFATTEADIVAMATRLASSGSIVGLSEAQIMAVATAMSSVGIEAEAGGSAISKLLKIFEVLVQTGAPGLADFAAVAGMSADEFSKAWGEDAIGALSLFIDGLGNIDAAGGSSVAVLEELDITEVRLSNAVLALASSQGILTDALGTANEAWESNSALAVEAATRYATTESKLTMLENSANNLKIAIGDALTPTIVDLADAGNDLLVGITKFVEQNPQVAQGVTITVTSIGGLLAALAAYQTSMRAIKYLKIPEMITGATEAFNGLSIAVGGAGVAAGSILTVLGSVVAGFIAIKEAHKDMTETGLIDTDSIQEAEANLAEMNKRLEEAQAKYNAVVDAGGDLSMVAYELDVARAGVINATTVLEDLEEAQKAAEEGFEDLGEAGTAAADEVAESIEDTVASVEIIQQKINALAADFSDAYVQAKPPVGLFDEFTAELSEDLDTTAEMIERWQEQTAALSEYTENLKLAAQYGLSEGLVKEFSDGSAESAAYLDVIISKIEALGGSAEGLGEDAAAFVDKFNTAFEGTETAKNDFAETVAAIETNLDDAIAEIAAMAEEADFSTVWEALDTAFANVDIDFSSVWSKFAESAPTEDDSGAVAEAVARSVETAIEAAGETMSESAGDLGASFIDGMASGAAEEEDAITETVTSMGETLTGAMTEAATSSVNAFIEEFQKIQDRTNEQIAALQAMIVEATAGMPVSMRAVGQGVVDGMIAGLNDRESSLYARIRSIVNTSIEAAREAAAVHSPSDKTTYIFEQVGEGMIVGAENKREKVKETLQSVVDEALRLDISGTATIEAAISRTNNPASQMEAVLSQMASLAKNRPSGGVTNNFYPKSMSKSEVDYFVRKIIREMGSMV